MARNPYEDEAKRIKELRAPAVLKDKLVRLHDAMTDIGEADMGYLSTQLAGRFHRATELVRSIVDALDK